MGSFDKNRKKDGPLWEMVPRAVQQSLFPAQKPARGSVGFPVAVAASDGRFRIRNQKEAADKGSVGRLPSGGFVAVLLLVRLCGRSAGASLSRIAVSFGCRLVALKIEAAICTGAIWVRTWKTQPD